MTQYCKYCRTSAKYGVEKKKPRFCVVHKTKKMVKLVEDDDVINEKHIDESKNQTYDIKNKKTIKYDNPRSKVKKTYDIKNKKAMKCINPRSEVNKTDDITNKENIKCINPRSEVNKTDDITNKENIKCINSRSEVNKTDDITNKENIKCINPCCKVHKLYNMKDISKIDCYYCGKYFINEFKKQIPNMCKNIWKNMRQYI